MEFFRCVAVFIASFAVAEALAYVDQVHGGAGILLAMLYGGLAAFASASYIFTREF